MCCVRQMAVHTSVLFVKHLYNVCKLMCVFREKKYKQDDD